MKKKLLIASLFTLQSFINPLSASTSDDSSIGKIDGEIRTVYYSRTASGVSGDGVPYLGEASGLAIGGHIGYTTPVFLCKSCSLYGSASIR